MQPPFVKEQKQHNIVSGAEVAFREHASRIRAKKTVDVGSFAQLPEDGNRSEQPVSVTVGGASAGADLDPDTYYQLISTADMHFNLSKEAGTAEAATTADTYLPANQPVIIYTDKKWRRIDVIQATTGGTAQIQRVLM